mgnify:CR=1 FL=1
MNRKHGRKIDPAWQVFTHEQLRRAKEISLEKGYCSTSRLMLDLKIFYSRALAIRKELVRTKLLTKQFQVRRRKCTVAA